MLESGSKVGDYEVLDPVGEGGTAMVYRVRHTALGSVFALKVLTISHPTAFARMMREGRLQATLSHPSVVSVHEVINFRGQPALVLEYVRGPSLGRVLHDRIPTTVEALRWFRQVVAGVAAAHAQNIIHRDIKPGNILLAERPDGTFDAKVTDFGLVKALGVSSSTTQTGVTVGTPAYMAPEQVINAKEVDHRADIFSLGCVLYALFGGDSPFRGSSMADVFDKIRSGTYPPLPNTTPLLVVKTVRSCLQKDPELRPQSCEAVLAMLEGEASPPPPKASAEQDQISPSVLIATIGALVVLAVAGMVTLGGGIGQAEPAPTTLTETAPPPPAAEVVPPPPSRCDKLVREDLGWVWAREGELQEGRFLPAEARNVRKDYPRAANNWSRDSHVVCILPAGTPVETSQAHPLEGGAWVDVRRVLKGSSQ